MDYQLIIKIPVSAIDDPAARVEAESLLQILGKEFNLKQETVQYKLQKIYKDKLPEGISL